MLRFFLSFFLPSVLGFGGEGDGSIRGRIESWGDGIRLSGRSVSGAGAVHIRWFLERLVDAPDVTFRPQDGIGGWGIRGQVIIPGCLSRRVCGANGG